MASAEHTAAAQPDRASAPVSMKALTTGILAAPLAWTAQELVSYGFVSRLCGDTNAAAAQHFAGASPMFLLISAITLAIALAGTWLGWNNWRKVSDVRRESNLEPREIHAERTRFMARVGLICNVVALCAFAFTISTLFVAPLCPA